MPFLDGTIENCDYEIDDYFKFRIPTLLGQIDPNILNPKRAWVILSEYQAAAESLVQKFQNNYTNYGLGDPEILAAGPSIS